MFSVGLYWSVVASGDTIVQWSCGDPCAVMRPMFFRQGRWQADLRDERSATKSPA